MKYLLWFVFLSILPCFQACKIDSKETTPVSARPNSFGEIHASSSFSWSTSKNVHLVLSGFQSNFPDEKTVLILSDNAGDILYKGFHLSGKSIDMYVRLPSTMDRIQLKYGICTKWLPIKDAAVYTTLLPELPSVE